MPHNTSFDRMSKALAGATSRRQALKLLGGSVVGGAFAGAGLAVAKDAMAKPDRGPNPLVVQYADVPVDDGRTFTGTATVTELAEGDSPTGVVAAGVVAGTLSDGEVVEDTFSGAPFFLSRNESANSLEGARAFAQGGSCRILFLTLGPLELDLLGLVIEIPDPIVIEVRGERGPGNLLGNLLCALAGLLDGTGGGVLGNLLSRINQLLSQILGGL